MINYSFYLPQVVCIKEETPTASDLSSSDTHLDRYNSVRTNQCSNPMDKTSSVQNCSNLYISYLTEVFNEFKKLFNPNYLYDYWLEGLIIMIIKKIT